MCTVRFGGRSIDTTMWEIGSGEYENLRILNYPNTDIFVICYSINDRASFENVWKNWYHELQMNCPEVPILLVGEWNFTVE